MLLKHLKVIQFKNLLSKELDFSSGINVITGDNGAGKTSILDAIYYLCFCKSYINRRDFQNISHNKEFFLIEGDFEKESLDYHVFCSFKSGVKKVVKLNEKTYDKISNHIGKFSSVIISPYDEDLIRGGSESRRKMMDKIISTISSTYIEQIIRYQKVLNQRNSLLKYFALNYTFDKNNLEIYDYELSQLGTKIFQQRKAFVELLSEKTSHFYKIISSDKEEVRINYESALFEKTFEETLNQNLAKDRAVQYTSSGIHKDNLHFNIGNDYLIKNYGSQGQQKSFLIALKLAEFTIISEYLGYKPLLLLDDIFDKIDDKRVGKIIHLVNDGFFGQIFITDTSFHRVKKIMESVEKEYQFIDM